MYSIIYADPPWYYNNRRLIRKDGGKSRYGIGAAGRYPVMKTDDICKLPVANLSADNCALFLWATFPRLDAGLRVMDAWGFDYKTVGFVWIKTYATRHVSQVAQTSLVKLGVSKFLDWLTFFGVGYYTKSNPEVCLLGIKGRMKPVDNSVSNVVYFPRLAHSEKPGIVRDKIVQLFGDLPRIELFARQIVDDWDSLGNYLDGRDIRDVLND
jgi:N6-adenosine-specific RNA methylase IME4